MQQRIELVQVVPWYLRAFGASLSLGEITGAGNQQSGGRAMERNLAFAEEVGSCVMFPLMIFFLHGQFSRWIGSVAQAEQALHRELCSWFV